jgi:hypothetical protein
MRLKVIKENKLSIDQFVLHNNRNCREEKERNIEEEIQREEN